MRDYAYFHGRPNLVDLDDRRSANIRVLAIFGKELGYIPESVIKKQRIQGIHLRLSSLTI